MIRTCLMTILFLITLPLGAFSAENISYEEALRIGAAGKHTESEKAFLSLIKKDPNNSEFWFRLGLMQRFQQKNDQSLASQKTALAISPQNSDAKLEIARLYFWNENYSQSEVLLKEILVVHPEYSQASDLLANVKAAQSPSQESGKYLWQLDAGHQHTSFSRKKQDDWMIDFVQIGRWVGSDTMVHFRNENIERFKQHDQYYQIGATHKFNDSYNGRLNVGRSPHASFYPRTRVDAGLEARVIHKHQFLGDTWLTGDVQNNRYQNFNVNVLKPGIRYSVLDELTIHWQHVEVIDENKKHLSGWVTRADWQTPLPQLRIFAGLADAPETENAVTINTKSRFIGFAYQLTPRITAYLSHNRDDRENSFIGKTFDGALSFKF